MLYSFFYKPSLPWIPVLLWVIFGSTTALAQPKQSDSDALNSQRWHYQKAKAALEREDLTAYAEHSAALGDYPLTPYLEFGELRKKLRDLPLADIDAFLHTYPDSFLATRLRSYLLQALAAEGKWKDYLHYYPTDSSSDRERCHALYARLATGDKTAFDDVIALWDVGQSQHDACDPVFRQWADAGFLTDEVIWNRMYKAIANRQMSLARYLSRKLVALKPRAELMFDVHQRPWLITQRDKFREQDTTTQHIIAHGIQRLARSKPLDALYHWEMYEAQQLFAPEISQPTKLEIVKRLIRGGHDQEAQHLLSYSHQLREVGLVEELIREALAELDWERVNETIMLLDEENRLSERWLYWRARAQDELDRSLQDLPDSQSIYRDLAQNRSFYGFVAADKLRQNYSLLDETTAIPAAVLYDVEQLPGMRRAQELWLTGNMPEAKAEWWYTSRSMTPSQLLAAGQLAREWGWYNSGIQAMISGSLWNQLTVRFPLAYREQIFKLADDTKVEPTFIYAIARQESAFDEQALSPVGAMGLMQLMPATAKFTAKVAGVAHLTRRDLLNAEHNMLLGSHYLNHLLERFEGNRILAAAAYNAGPHRVNKWLSKQGEERPYDVWIETIPFRETRHYVQNVLCYSVIYGYRLGQPVQLVSAEEALRQL